MKLHFSFCELFGVCAVLEGNVAAINEASLRRRMGKMRETFLFPLTKERRRDLNCQVSILKSAEH